MSSCVIPDVLTISFGLVLTIGTSLSYIPQQIRIIRLRSSRGISPMYLFISAVFSFGSILSICLLQYDTFQCCTKTTVNFWDCNLLLLNVYQIAVMPLNLGFIFLLCVIFVDPDPAPEDHPNPKYYEWKQKMYMYLMFFWACMLFGYGVYTGTLLILGWGHNSTLVTRYAQTISIIVLISTLIQYFPQIYETFRYKHSGSVSVITLAIQAPGNLAVVIYQLLSGSTVATWLPFLSSFIQQSILIVEIFYFDCIKKNNNSEKHQEDNDDKKNLLDDTYSLIQSHETM